MLHKFKSVVKLQAAVRGHLVRRQAIGTLRCIIAIIRMQAFVKARHARQIIGNIPSSGDAKFEVYNSEIFQTHCCFTLHLIGMI